MITFGTVCSGIGSPEAAWSQLGWRASFASEIEPFPRAVLKHHYPETPLHGDFTTIQAGEYADIDVLCGGTPCQSFSVAGLRGGMADARGNLALEFLRLADRLRPRWVVYENVPGILSSNGGRDFGSLLGGLAELGYGWAYRSLDAQFFNLAQRRQRVFVVGYLGDWRRAAAVLFEPASLRGNPAPRRESRKDVAPTISARTSVGGGLGSDFDCDGGLIAFGGNNQAGPIDVSTAINACHTASGRQDFESETFVVSPPLTHNPSGDHVGREGLLVAHALTANGFDASEDGNGRGTLGFDGDTQMLRPIKPQPDHQMILQGYAVRRLTPKECARLQGFSDTYLDILYRGKPAADGPKYRALGNSMAVNVMSWLGKRIEIQHRQAIQTKEIAA